MSSGPPTGEQAVRVTRISVDEAAVRRHLGMADLLLAKERALIDFSVGRGVQPDLVQIGGVAEMYLIDMKGLRGLVWVKTHRFSDRGQHGSEDLES